MDTRDSRGVSPQDATYSVTARRFHWWTVAFLAVQIPVGLYMAYRGRLPDGFDAITNFLYNSHKTLGIIILAVVILRLLYRLVRGAPDHEPSITGWQRTASRLNHWGLYLLLLIVPVLGYIGISLYPALDIFGLVSLPGLVAPNQEAAARVFYWHWVGAVAIVLLVGMHVAAALFHYLIRRDGVLRRMWVRAGRLS